MAKIKNNPVTSGLHMLNMNFGQVRGIADNVDETREIEFVISSEARDRYNTVLLLDNWQLDNYERNPVVGYNHPFFDYWGDTYNPDKVIGTARVFKDNDARLLIGAVTFEPEDVNPLAEKIFKKVKHGTLKSTSVGFFETKRGGYGKGSEAIGEENETYYYGGQELLEFSIVDIPANTDATIRSIEARLKENYSGFVANELEAIRRAYAKGEATAPANLALLEKEMQLLKL